MHVAYTRKTKLQFKEFRWFIWTFYAKRKVLILWFVMVNEKSLEIIINVFMALIIAVFTYTSIVCTWWQLTYWILFFHINRHNKKKIMKQCLTIVLCRSHCAIDSLANYLHIVVDWLARLLSLSWSSLCATANARQNPHIDFDL